MHEKAHSFYKNSLLNFTRSKKTQTLNLSPRHLIYLERIADAQDMNDRKQVCFMSQAELANRCGVSERTLRNTEKDLIKMNLIVRRRKWKMYHRVLNDCIAPEPMTKAWRELSIEKVAGDQPTNLPVTIEREEADTKKDQKLYIIYSSNMFKFYPITPMATLSMLLALLEMLRGDEEVANKIDVQELLSIIAEIKQEFNDRLHFVERAVIESLQDITAIQQYEPMEETDMRKVHTINRKPIEEHERARRFEEFWEVYPRKEGKKRAYDIWRRKALDTIADKLIEDILLRQSKHVQWRNKEFIPHPSTYLNGERWTDEIIDESMTVATQQPKQSKGGIKEYYEQIQRAQQRINNPTFRKV